MEMQTINAEKPLPEIKRRIRELLKDKNIKIQKIQVDRIIIGDKHRIHFTISTDNYLLTGDIYQRIIGGLKVIDHD
jgi:hypothetical protein